MNTYQTLSSDEQLDLLKFPVYISLLAANADGTTDDQEKNTAIAFEHTKTYTSNAALGDFYTRSEKLFKENWVQLDQELPKGKKERDEILKKRLAYLNHLLSRFDNTYKTVMHKSMNSFKEHVSQAHHNILEDFIFPVPISGINA